MRNGSFSAEGESRRLLEDALAAATRALMLLDEAGAPAYVGAHFDHGIKALEGLLSAA